MPRSAVCPPSQRSATTARASRTWWLSVPTRRWRPALRTNPRLPRPSVQGLRPTSTLQRRRSTPALLRWRGPPPPQRSPTQEAPGPRGGGNAENDPQGPVLSAPTSDSCFSCQSRTPEAPPPHPPSSTSHLEKILWLFSFLLYIFMSLTSFAKLAGVAVYECTPLHPR